MTTDIQSKPIKIIISATAIEHEKEEGVLKIKRKKVDGYIVYENKAGYDFIYDPEIDENFIQNALEDLKSGNLEGYNSTDSECSRGISSAYYNDNDEEIDYNNVDDFNGCGDTTVIEINTPYGYYKVVVELENAEKIIWSRGESSDEADSFTLLKNSVEGAKILEILSSFSVS